MSAEIQLKRDADKEAPSPSCKRKRQASRTSSRKCCYAKDAFRSLNDFREKEFLCDFKIIAGKMTYNVHRSVLASRSPYFHEIFTVNPLQKEMKWGENSHDSVRTCIEYMYTGDISVNFRNVEGIFNVSLAFQLEEVSELCCNCFSNDLTIENCLTYMRLAGKFKDDLSNKFGIMDLESKAENFAVSNMAAVIQTDAFLKVSVKELIRLLKFSHLPLVISKALIVWVSHDFSKRSSELKTVLKSINMSRFSVEEIVLMTCDHKFMASPGVFELLGYEVLQRGQYEHCTTQNWSDVRDLAIRFKLSDLEVKVNRYVLENFNSISQTQTFYKVDKFTLIYFVKAIPVTKSRESAVWNAILNWTRFHEERKICFPEIIKTVGLSQFSLDLIKNTIKDEPLINKDNECLKMVIEALCRKSN